MYRPNSIQSRLVIKEDEPGGLLQEVNDTLDSLMKWKEEQRQLDEQLEKDIAERRSSTKVQIDEETTPELEMEEIKTSGIKYEPAKLIEISNTPHQVLVTAPEIQNINNYDLYKAGSALNEMLTDWNSSMDFLMTGPKAQEKQGEEWDQINDIEKELEELEELMGSVSKLESDIIE